jgi:hypothetical protein
MVTSATAYAKVLVDLGDRMQLVGSERVRPANFVSGGLA